MLQGPKGYIAQICEVHLSMETVQQNGRFTLFSSKFQSNIYSILFNYNQYFYCITINTLILFQSILLFYYNQYCYFTTIQFKLFTYGNL